MNQEETVADMYGLGPQIKGVETCKIMNYLMLNLNFKYFLKIGDKPYMVVHVRPLMHDMIRVDMVGHSHAEVFWNTKFDFYLGGNTQEYHYPVKEGAKPSPITNAI